jgi:GNAT superfamily N-acetyltransferase
MEKDHNFPKKEKFFSEISENGNDISFNIASSNEMYKASLQCEINIEQGVLIARTIVVEKEFARQGLGGSLFIEAIKYAKKHNLGFVTDYGISEDAERLIQSLASKGYTFTKNPNAVEKQGNTGKRIVTFDGSPVYILNN